MPDTPSAPHRPGYAAPFGEPAPDDVLTLQPAEGQQTGEAAPVENAESIPTSDEPPLESPTQTPAELAERARLQREEREAQRVEPSVKAEPPGPLPPVRVRTTYHVFLTERRGAAKWAPRSYQVGTVPVQILGLNENRRRAVIQVVGSTGDGYFLAFGSKGQMPQGVSTTFTGERLLGMPERLRQTKLFPLIVPAGAPIPSPFPPDDFTIEHVREVWAVFVPDTVLTDHGKFAILSVSEESGDSGLAQEDVQAPGANRDR